MSAGAPLAWRERAAARIESWSLLMSPWPYPAPGEGRNCMGPRAPAGLGAPEPPPPGPAGWVAAVCSLVAPPGAGSGGTVVTLVDGAGLADVDGAGPARATGRACEQPASMVPAAISAARRRVPAPPAPPTRRAGRRACKWS